VDIGRTHSSGGLFVHRRGPVGRSPLLTSDLGGRPAKAGRKVVTVISTLERLSPSWVSQERWSSLPVTTTLVPLASEVAAFSARLPQATTSKNEVDPVRSWLWRSVQVRLTAIPEVAVAWPLGVKRAQVPGSTLPAMVTVLSVILSVLLT